MSHLPIARGRPRFPPALALTPAQVHAAAVAVTVTHANGSGTHTGTDSGDDNNNKEKQTQTPNTPTALAGTSASTPIVVDSAAPPVPSLPSSGAFDSLAPAAAFPFPPFGFGWSGHTHPLSVAPKPVPKTYHTWSLAAERALVSLKTNADNFRFSLKNGVEGTNGLSSLERKQNWDSIVEELNQQGFQVTSAQVKSKWEGMWGKHKQIRNLISQNVGNTHIEKLRDTCIGYDQLDRLWNASLTATVETETIEMVTNHQSPPQPQPQPPPPHTVDLSGDAPVDSHDASPLSSSSSLLVPAELKRPSLNSDVIAPRPHKRQKTSAPPPPADLYVPTRASAAAAAATADRHDTFIADMAAMIQQQQAEHAKAIESILAKIDKIAPKRKSQSETQQMETSQQTPSQAQPSTLPTSSLSSSPSTSESIQLNPAGMSYVRLGSSGLKVSRIALGCMTYGDTAWRAWALDREASKPFIRKALESGINFFDTADDSLGASETILGSILNEFGTRRQDLVIATKVFFQSKGPNTPNSSGLSRKHIFDAVDASLKRLQMDYIDLYQIHRWDNNVSAEEVMCALNDLVRSGKVRYIGASSMYTWQFQHCQHVAEKNGWTKFVSMQNHYNLVYREEEREMNPYCAFSGVGLIPWSPFARGFLTGVRSTMAHAKQDPASTIRAQTDPVSEAMYGQPEDYEIAERVNQLAEMRGVKPAQIALAWLLHKSGVSAPIIGASKMYQLEEAIAAIPLKLDDAEMKFLEEKYRAHPVLGYLS